MRVTVHSNISQEQYEALVDLAVKHNVTISLYIKGIIADALADEGSTIAKPVPYRKRGPKLTPAQRIEIANLIRLEDRTFKEIADRYGIHVHTVAQIAGRAGLSRPIGGLHA